jgi:hypothetical protein
MADGNNNGGLIQQILTTLGAFGTEGLFQQGIASVLQEFESSFLKNIEGVELGAKDFSPLGAIGYWNKINKEIMNVNQGLGIAGALGQNVQESFRATLMDAAEYGATYKDIAQEYQNFVDQLGLSRQLTSQELLELVKVQKVFGESSAEIFAMYTELGVSFAQTAGSIERIGVESNKIGVNYSKVIKELKNNLNLINRMSFARGRRGLEEMAKMAVKTKISMQTVSGLVDDIFDKGIEGAIEMGAELQMMGGEAAKLGDPFELMYLGRNRPEELQKRVADMTKEFATFNKETGEITFSGLGMDRMRKIAGSLGMDFEELAESSRRLRKESEIKSRFDFSIRGKKDFDEMLSKVASSAEFDTNLNDWVVKIGEESKRIGELTPEMIGQLDFLGTDKIGDVNERLIKSNESLNETMQRLIDQFKLGMLSGVQENYQKMYDVTRNLAENLRENMLGGDFKVMMEMFKDLSSKSFENFLELYKKIGEGDVFGAAGVAGGRIGEAALGLLEAIVQTLAFMARAFIGVVQWGVSYLATELGNAFIYVGNGIVRAITFGTVEQSMDYMTGDTLSSFMPPLSDLVEGVLPEFLSKQVMKKLESMDFDTPEMKNKDYKGMGYEDSKAKELMDVEKIKDATKEDGKSTSIDINLNGQFDLNTNLLTPAEKEQWQRMNEEFFRDKLTNKNMRGGKNTRTYTDAYPS